MNFLTRENAREWLQSSKAYITESDELQFHRSPNKSLRFGLPTEPTRLAQFCYRLINMIPKTTERMLYVQRWHTYPQDSLTFFESTRTGLGCKDFLVERPAHVIDRMLYLDFDARRSHDIREESALSGLLMLTLCFDFSCFVIGQYSNDALLYEDELILFLSDEKMQIDSALSIANSFGLKVR